MKRKVLLAIMVMGLAGPAWSTIVTPTIENSGFEIPGAELTSWEDVPGWNSDSVAANSGVESGLPDSTEGIWTGYLYNGDPSVFNLTEHITQLDDEFILQLDARDRSTDNPPALLDISLFLDVYGGRITIASKTVEVSDSWTTFSIDYFANTFPAVYNKIGIELANVTPTGESWINIDNIQFIPEPATIVLLGFGTLVLIKSRKH